jgi:hypothetical protein
MEDLDIGGVVDADRHHDILRLIPVVALDLTYRAKIGFGNLQVLNGHPDRYPPEVGVQRDVQADTAGELRRVAHGDRVDRINVVVDRATFRELQRDMARPDLRERRPDGAEVWRLEANHPADKPATDAAATVRLPEFDNRAS